MVNRIESNLDDSRAIMVLETLKVLFDNHGSYLDNNSRLYFDDLFDAEIYGTIDHLASHLHYDYANIKINDED